MEEDNWKYTLVGLIIFFAICFFINWLSEKAHKPKDLWECNGPYSHTDDKLPKCPSWMFE